MNTVQKECAPTKANSQVIGGETCTGTVKTTGVETSTITLNNNGERVDGNGVCESLEPLQWVEKSCTPPAGGLASSALSAGTGSISKNSTTLGLGVL